MSKLQRNTNHRYSSLNQWCCMHNSISIWIIVTALFLWGCGESSDSTNNVTSNIANDLDSTKNTTVDNNAAPNSYDELVAKISCNVNSMGTIVYIASENAFYSCSSDSLFSQFNWVLTQTTQSIQSQVPNNTPVTEPLPINDKLADLPLILGTMTDPRDGKTYRTTTIGTQTWMAENLNYTTAEVINLHSDSLANLYIETEGKKEKVARASGSCLDSRNDNCVKYGRYYSWNEAVQEGSSLAHIQTVNFTTIVQGVCPNGWHIPSKDEWNALILTIKDSDPSNHGDVKSALQSTNGWVSTDGSNRNSYDTYGFSTFPSGYCTSSSTCHDVGINALFWLINNDYKEASCIDLNLIGSIIPFVTSCSKSNDLNVRCIKNDP